MVASASAAAPEYGRCLKAPQVNKKYTGKYGNSKCIPPKTEAEKKAVEKGEGKFEWHPGVEKKHMTTVGGAGILEEVAKYAVACTHEESSGEYSGTKEIKNVIVKFKGCKVTPYICTSEGHEEGELETKPLEGRVVWLNEAKRTTGLDLFPAKGEETYIEFSCGAAITVAVKGSVLVPIKNDTMSTTVPLNYKAKKAFQVPEYYEEGGVKIKDVLLSDFAGKGYDQAGINIKSTATNEEKLELNAYF